MKANKLPQSDACDSLYHSPSAKSKADYNSSNTSLIASANDENLLNEQQKLDNKHTLNNGASNDASYLSNYSVGNTLDSNVNSHDISCGYKKSTNIHSSYLSPSVNDMIINNEINAFKSFPYGSEVKSEFQIQSSNIINSTAQDNINKKTIVSERIFMTSLLKHTGIALAIIIPLAAFSAYAATPVQPFDAPVKTATATIDIAPNAIIHNSASQPTTVDSVDLERYSGTWYEIGRLPMYFQRNCASDVTANYTEKTDGSGIVVTNKCLDKKGSQIVAEGLAKPADDTGSKLKVTFLPSWIRSLPVGRADYWVLARDADYNTALVGTPNKKYLWLLARSPNVTQQTYTKYRQIAQDQGYDLQKFTLTPHLNQKVNLLP